MTSQPVAPQKSNAPQSVAPREVRLEDLLRGDRELLIRHGEQVYRLRITRNGRLLLTK
jgi:hemin uptake protein HemP